MAEIFFSRKNGENMAFSTSKMATFQNIYFFFSQKTIFGTFDNVEKSKEKNSKCFFCHFFHFCTKKTAKVDFFFCLKKIGQVYTKNQLVLISGRILPRLYLLTLSFVPITVSHVS